MSSIEQLDIEPATLFCPLRSSRDEEEFQWSSESAGARDDGVRQLQTDPMRVEGNIKDGGDCLYFGRYRNLYLARYN